MGGWSILYDDPSKARFTEILGLDEKLADDIIRETRNHPDSDNEDSLYSWFSHPCLYCGQ